MKCKKCGLVVKTGEVYCQNCGTEIQIVPDYSAFEEDITSAISTHEKATVYQKKQELEEEFEKTIKNETAPKKKDKKKIALIITLSVIVVAALALCVSVFFSNRKKNQSFAYQYERAESYYNNQLPDKALEAIDRALNIESENEQALLLKATILNSLNRENEAINTLLTLIQVNPNSYDAYRMLVDVYAEKGDYKSIAELAKNSMQNEMIVGLFAGYVPVAPKFKQIPGNYEDILKLEIQTDSNSQVFYTIDGSSPISNGLVYTQEIELQPGEYTIKVVSTNEYGIFSEEVEGHYVIQQTIPDKPIVSLPSGTYKTAEKITISVPDGCVAYYTWDGSIPNASSFKYSGPFDIIEGNNILSVIIMNANNKCSEVARFNYIYYNVDSDGE